MDDNQNFHKICVIDLGQVGDVIMSFPALIELRKRFPSTELVVVAGKTPAELIRGLQLADDVIAIDRYALLNGPKLKSVSKIFRLVMQVRQRRFDLVIDLHSLYESNLLGFLSGTKHRLFANRRNRSLDVLSNFRPRPPLYDAAKHLAGIYLDVLQPLGIVEGHRDATIAPPTELVERFREEHIKPDTHQRRYIGLAIGAGNPSRRWALNNFVELAKRFHHSGGHGVFVFLGPEEKKDEELIRKHFGDLATVVPDLSLIELAAAFSTLDIVVGNDTGTTHLAAVSGPRVVMVSDKRAPNTFTPLGSRSAAVRTDVIEKITVDDVWSVVELPNEGTHEHEQPKEN